MISLSPEMRANFRHLYADITWWGILAGSTQAFLAVYAARRGASSLEISLLTAGPAVVSLIFSLPAGRSLESRPLIPATFWWAVLNRLGYLALVPLPWLFGPSGQVWAVIVITLLMSLPGAYVSIAFNAMFADLVPPERRGEVVGKRNALFSVTMTASTLACGQLLDHIPPPLNYPLVFALGVVGAGMSAYHLWHLKSLPSLPPRVGLPLADFARPGAIRFLDAMRLPAGLRFLTRSKGKPLLRFDLLRGPFGLFLGAYMMFYTFQYLSLPLFPLFQVNQLHLTDGAISLGGGLFYAVMLLVSLRLGDLTARFGHRHLLGAGATLFSLYPLLISLAKDATLFWIASLIGGGVWAITGAGLVNRLMERVPEADRPASMALHNLALNLGVLVGSLGGPFLAAGMGLQHALLLGAALRLLAGIVLWIYA